MSLSTRICFVLIALALCTSGGWAAVTNYPDRASFERAVDGLVTQGFETPFETGASAAFDGFTVAEQSNFANVSSRTDHVSQGVRALGFTWNGKSRFVFAFNPPIDAFAADILDFGTCCGAEKLDVVSDTGAIELIAATGVDRPRGNLQFFGVSSDTPFSELVFSSELISNNDLIVFDNLKFHPIPEPHLAMAWPVAWVLMSIRVTRRCRSRFSLV